MISRILAGVCGLMAALCAGVPAAGQSAWVYDLRPGDHLTYRYTFQRHVQSDDAESEVEARFRTHVLVAGERAGEISLGFERIRESAELSVSRHKGKDRLAQDRVDFDKRMRTRPSRFSEAQEISPIGEPRHSWEMARETYSHVLDAFHEIMGLPPIAVKKGEAWRGSSLLGLDLRWVEDETIHGKLCHRVEGAVPDGSLKLSYWWSPESGVLEQVGLDATYGSYGGTVHEVARMELAGRSRGESPESWLGDADARLAALQAILLSSGVAVSAAELTPALSSDDATAQALALAIASRRKLDLPPALVGKLANSASSPVRDLAARFTGAGDSPAVDPCGRKIPGKPEAAKFGTAFEAVPAAKDDSAIPYLLRVPLTYRSDRPTPLLIYLSGGAGLAIDGVNSAEDVVADTDYLVLYPHAAQYWWKPEMARKFDAVFQQVVAHYNVDPDRVYLTGFSNGGTGALYFAEMWPQRFAAVVSLMGAGQCMEDVKAGLSNVENLPLLFVHGERDPLITPDCSTATQAALEEMRPAMKPELKILPNREHDITLQSDDGLTLTFFKNKVRNPFPRDIQASLLDAQAARQYWIEIVDGRSGKAGLDARVKSDNTIEIHSHDVKRIRLHLRPELFAKPGDVRVQWNGKKMESGAVKDGCAVTPVAPGPDPKLDRTDIRELTLP